MDRLLHQEQDRQASENHPARSITFVKGDTGGKIIDVISADYVGDYKIQVDFSDGHRQIVDFGSFLTRSTHPQIRQYLDAEKFQAFDIIWGNLNWNDYELCFPVVDLYENRIDKFR